MDALEGDDYYDVAELESSDGEEEEEEGEEGDLGYEKSRARYQKGKEEEGGGRDSDKRQRGQSALKKRGKEKVPDDLDLDAEEEEEEEEEEEDELSDYDDENGSDDSQEPLDVGDEEYLIEEEDGIEDDDDVMDDEDDDDGGDEEEGNQRGGQTDGQTMYAKLVASKRAQNVIGGSSTMQRHISQERPTKDVQGFSPGFDDIMNFTKSLSGRGRGRRQELRRGQQRSGKRRTENVILRERCGKMISDAMLLSTTDSAEAIAMLLEVVRIAPQYPDTYSSLGMVHQGIGDHVKAIQYYMMAAELSGEDVGKWREIVQQALQHNQKQQAIYCLNTIVRIDPQDTEAVFLLVDLSMEVQDFWRAIKILNSLEASKVERHDIVQRLVPCYHAVGDNEKAIQSIEQYLREKWKRKEEIDLTLVNILCELYVEERRFQEAGDLIVRVAVEDSDSDIQSTRWSVYDVLDRDSSIHKTLTELVLELPLDLVVKFGIAACHLDHIEEASDFFKLLLSENVEDYPDLYHTVGALMLKLGKSKSAVQFLQGALQVWSIEQNVSVAHELAEAQTLAGFHEAAEITYREILKSFPQDTTAQFGLSALLSAREQPCSTAADAHQIAAADVEMRGDVLEEPDFNQLKPLSKLAHLKLLLSLSQFPRAAWASRSLMADLLEFISSGSYLHYLQGAQPNKRTSQATLSEHMRGRDREALFSGEESDEYKRLVVRIKNRRHYKSLIGDGRSPEEALSLALEALREGEKQRNKDAETLLQVESAGYLDIINLGRGLEDLLALTVDLQCACELENKSLRLISKVATACAEEKAKVRAVISKLRDKLPSEDGQEASKASPSQSASKRRKPLQSCPKEDVLNARGVVSKLTTYHDSIQQILNRLPFLELGVGIIMVGNEKASAPSIESLRSACESSDAAPLGLWNWVAALKSQRRNSVLKNYLSKVISERPGNYAARLLRANQSKLAGRSSSALMEYLKVLEQAHGDRPIHSLASLYAGITCLDIAMSKRELARYAQVESSTTPAAAAVAADDNGSGDEDDRDNAQADQPAAKPKDDDSERRTQRECLAQFCRSGLALLVEHAAQAKILSEMTGNAGIFAESIYNVARGAHAIGQLFLAEQLYKQCLEIVAPLVSRWAQVGQGEEGCSGGQWSERQYIGLQRQAAYNLSCIYSGSGNVGRAREILAHYCTI